MGCLIEKIKPFSLFRTASKCSGGKNIKVRKTFTHKALLSFISQLCPFRLSSPAEGKKKKLLFHKNFY